MTLELDKVESEIDPLQKIIHG